MRILILGAAGEISRRFTKRILNERQDELILYARNGTRRLTRLKPKREKIIDGDFTDWNILVEAMEGVDIVYLNSLDSPAATQQILNAMKICEVDRLICSSILGIYDELIARYGHSYARIAGNTLVDRQKLSAEIIEQSGINYTILRMTWLYNQRNNERYVLTQKSEPVRGRQVAREAVARLLMDILADPECYAQQSLGVAEPNADWTAQFYIDDTFWACDVRQQVLDEWK
ncbi:NAD(P)H-binding protein [Enterococcus sp. CWB-B31]|uniref:NAD(P)H-binding protein n=1 Tax=Enterococcus sp. CWB-B31 TaxID=2885159 RepID=UPI001E56E4F7|nr:NAD(P)H-binding protein [Enterococcus sp. CWB-B31]MCB5953414.1 NAD(P)H-binding protein [Enterococcus sp. CWB-B31]